ncbi:MAG: DUF748 domain-containing protein [Bacteroidia bacterium]
MDNKQKVATDHNSGQARLDTNYKKHRRKVRRRAVLGSVLALLILLRLFLPYIVLNYVNKKLANLKEYYGHVADIDIALIRGAYVIHDIKIVKTEKSGQNTDTIPFFKSPTIDLSVEWAAIFKGSVVGEIYVEDPVLNFVKGKHKGEDVKADTADFRKLIKDLMPLTVNHFEITNGEIHYIDKYAAPKLDISLKNIEAVATNLSNVNDSAKQLPANLKASGNAYEGNFTLNVNFDALNEVPTFDLNAELTTVNLVQLNDFLRAYGNFDVDRGRFGLYTEFAAKDGSYGGYVKPIIKDMKVVNWKEDKDNILWESLIGAAAQLLKNRQEKQVATKVPIEGNFEKGGKINLWRAISFVLRNAFVHALKPTIDGSININKLDDDQNKTVLEKIFSKTEKKVEEKTSGKKTKKEERQEKRKERRAKRRDERQEKGK